MAKQMQYRHLKNEINRLILDLLNAGTPYVEIYNEVYNKYQMCKSTFDYYFKPVNATYHKETEQIRKVIFKDRKKNTIKMIKNGDITKERVLRELLFIIEKATQPRDRINALKLVCDIEGYKAPTKTDVTLRPVTPVFSYNPLLNNVIDITPPQAKPLLNDDTSDIM